MKKVICFFLAVVLLMGSCFTVSAASVSVLPAADGDFNPFGPFGRPSWGDFIGDVIDFIRPPSVDDSYIDTNIPSEAKRLAFREAFQIDEKYYPYIIINEKRGYGMNHPDGVYYKVFFLSQPAYVGSDGWIYTDGEVWRCTVIKYTDSDVYFPVTGSMSAQYPSSVPVKFPGGNCQSSYSYHNKNQYVTDKANGLYNRDDLFRCSNFKLGDYEPPPETPQEEPLNPKDYGIKDFVGVEIPDIKPYIEQYGIWGIALWLRDVLFNIMACIIENIVIFFNNIKGLFFMLKDLFKNMLKALFEELFVPRDGFIDEIKAMLSNIIEEKFPILYEAYEVIRDLFSFTGGSEIGVSATGEAVNMYNSDGVHGGGGRPIDGFNIAYNGTAPCFTFEVGNGVAKIDFAPFEPYMTPVRVICSGFSFVALAWYLFRNLIPALIGRIPKD